MTAASFSQDDLLALHAEACRIAAATVGVSCLALRKSRTRKASFARQVAMYLIRMQGVSLRQLGQLFDGRGLNSVHHALRAVEDARDDNAVDAIIDALEISLRRYLRSVGRPTRYGLEIQDRAG